MSKQWVTNCFGDEDVSQLLTGERIPKNPDQPRDYYRRLSIVTEGDWFYSKLSELQLLSGSGILTCLGQSPCTHEHKQITKDNSTGRVVWVETHGYTVLASGWESEISIIRGLEAWCREHVAEAAKVLEVPTDWLIPAIDSQFYTLNPNMEGLGEGNSPEYFFSVLRTVAEMMRFTKFHNDKPNFLLAVYHRVLRYGS